MFSSAFTSLNRLSHVIVNKADFLKILENYQKRTVTAEEHAILIAYYDAFEHELDVLAVFSETEQSVLKEEILENILKNIDGVTKSVSEQNNYNLTVVNQKTK